MILSTHILPEVAATCERVIIIHEGHIVGEDTVANLGQTGRRKVRVCINGPTDKVANSLKGIHGVEGVRTLENSGETSVFLVDSAEKDVRADIFQAVVKGDWVLLEMRPETASLEEAFIQLTSGDSRSATSSGGDAA